MASLPPTWSSEVLSCGSVTSGFRGLLVLLQLLGLFRVTTVITVITVTRGIRVIRLLGSFFVKLWLVFRLPGAAKFCRSVIITLITRINPNNSNNP